MLVAEDLRSAFPSLQEGGDVFLDNAGGSQVPACVADAVRDFMLSTCAQLDAEYETSRRATAAVRRAHAFIELFVNAGSAGRVVLGPSTTVLCGMLADCYRRAGPGTRDEIVVAESSHEANAGPWHRLADHGFTVRTWPLDVERFALRGEDLAPLLSERTRLVAFPHVSNLLGHIDDAAGITQLARACGARVVIDGVAFAPHRPVDVAAIGADWYVYSTYKVLGPHMAALFGRHEALAEIEGPNHFFIPRDEIPYKLEPGGPSYEGCAGLLGLWPYLARAAGADPASAPRREVIERAFERFAGIETALQRPLVEYLRGRWDVRLAGPAATDASRVCTVSFVHERRRSRDIVRDAGARGFGLRHGHCYAYRLCERLAAERLVHDVDDGVTRVSLLHYNTPDEIGRLLACLDAIL